MRSRELPVWRPVETRSVSSFSSRESTGSGHAHSAVREKAIEIGDTLSTSKPHGDHIIKLIVLLVLFYITESSEKTVYTDTYWYRIMIWTRKIVQTLDRMRTEVKWRAVIECGRSVRRGRRIRRGRCSTRRSHNRVPCAAHGVTASRTASRHRRIDWLLALLCSWNHAHVRASDEILQFWTNKMKPQDASLRLDCDKNFKNLITLIKKCFLTMSALAILLTNLTKLTNCF